MPKTGPDLRQPTLRYAVVNTWAAADGWNDRESLLSHSAAALFEEARRAELAVLATLYPDDPAPRELAAILDEITTDSLATTLTRHRDAAAFEQLFTGWLATPTWTASRDYLATHPDLVTDPRTRAILEANATDNPEIAQHLGILNLITHRSLTDVYDIVLDPAVAADEALAAATAGDIETLTNLWIIALRLSRTPFIGAFLASIHALLATQPDQATALALTAAKQATELQRGAAIARLRRLSRTRPDLALTLDELIKIYEAAEQADPTTAG